jgi:hypothetical protein
MKVREHRSDPVFVKSRPSAEKIELRLGEASRGKTRYAVLQPQEARRIGYALLYAAEEVQKEATP